MFLTKSNQNYKSLLSSRGMDDLFSLWTWEPLSHAYDNGNVVVENTENEVIIRIVSPGMKNEDFKITLEDDILTVSYDAERNIGGSYGKQRRTFQRKWSVPKETTEKDLTASYDAGILIVTMKKREPLKIPVKTIKVT